MTRCCILGLGYIGLPTAAILANHGHSVIGVDINQTVVDTVNEGLIHIVEPDLEQSVSSAVRSQRLIASSKPHLADVYIIAVPTPFINNNDTCPKPDIRYVMAAASSITHLLKPDDLIVIESTCPVGTTEKVAHFLAENIQCKISDLHVCYCPERVLPGRILEELVTNDRVIGGLSVKSSHKAKEFYSSFCSGSLHCTTARVAEMVKLTENSYRDVNIAFANEISIISSELGVDPYELIRLANYHPRVNILQPGSGVGGHCIAVDPWFLASASPDNSHLIKTARKVNNNKTAWVINQIRQECLSISSSLGRPLRLGCMGVTFKPDIDDLRESPALHVVMTLISEGYDVQVCEPNIHSHPSFPNVPLQEIIQSSDILIFLVSHKSFKNINFTSVKCLDFCGVLMKS